MTEQIKILKAKIEMYENSSIPSRVKEQIMIKLQEEIQELENNQKNYRNRIK